MRGRTLTVWLLVAIPVAVACGRTDGGATQSGAGAAQAGAPAGADKAADDAALRAIYRELPHTLTSGDTTAMAALFLDDGVEFVVGMAPMQGHAAIAKGLASVMATMKNLALTMGDAVVTISSAGDLAVVKAPYRMTFTDPKGRKAEDRGTSMTVFRKVNGQWKILYDTAMSEVMPTQ